jgi:peptidyl-prolyl cis-trans isomerase SurA
MKKIILLTSFLLVQKIITAQNLFTFGKDAVTRTEFINNFLRNANNLQGDRKAALQENLELYIRYKLKVKAAYDEKLDTLQNQQEDLQGFKRQIEGKYLTEDKMMKSLTEEAFQRMQKDIRVSHIIVLLDKKTNDTTVAYKKINEAYAKLKQGQDFAALAKQYSEDATAPENGGDLGYITAFTLPYNLESLAYNTPSGKYSTIYKSSFAYHIFKHNGERKALGKMQAAQILLQIQPTSSQAIKDALKTQIDSLYEKLAKGEVFENYARTYSNDMYSASAGGLMQEFGVGKYDAVFENTFAKLKDGEVSKPFLTAFGWHILKRISSTVPSKILDATTEQEIIGKIGNDSRKQKAEEVFLSTVYKSINFKENAVNTVTLFKDVDARNFDPTAKLLSNEKDVLHTIANNKVTVGDFLKFAKDARSTATYQNYDAEKLFKEYKKVTALEYYRKNLERYNSDYKAQVNEFKDGNMLFEIMERNVWNKSANDEDGLKKYYAANQKK